MARGEIHIQLAVNYGEDQKLRALARFGRDARACRDLYVQMLCYCKRNLTDGYVPVEEVGVLVYPDTPKNGLRDAERLVEVGLAKPIEGGYLLPGFLKRNKSKAQVAAESEAKAEAGRRGGKRSGEVRRGTSKAEHPASSPEAGSEHLASGDEADAKQAASGCLNTETETETETVTPSACADAQPGAVELVLVDQMPPPAKPKRKPAKRKPNRTVEDDLADELTNGYWDLYGKDQAKEWIAVRQRVLTALHNGNHRDEVAWALDAIGRRLMPVTANTLSVALGEVKRARQQGQGSSRTGAIDRKQQATNDMFERALARAAAREEAS